MNTDPLRRCWAEIDLALLKKNVATLQNHIGDGCGIMAVIKANAYGHGITTVASALADYVAAFGVANVSEALEISENGGLNAEILILSPVTPDEMEIAVSQGFACSVSNIEEVRFFEGIAENLGIPAKLHAVADTGMGRMGAFSSEFPELVGVIDRSEHCLLAGLMTHFPNADEDGEFTRNQIVMFSGLLKELQIESKPWLHLANSAGLIDFRDEMPFATIFRPGLAVYGVSPECENKMDLTPVMTLKSRVTLVREIAAGTTISYGSTFVAPQSMKVASIAVGYGDGYRRNLSGQDADVLINGVRCRLLGRVTMDQIVVDVSHLTEVEVGDEVVLLGCQGGEEITADELAEKAGTIPWEIYTGISSRVKRVYR